MLCFVLLRMETHGTPTPAPSVIVGRDASHATRSPAQSVLRDRSLSSTPGSAAETVNHVRLGPCNQCKDGPQNGNDQIIFCLFVFFLWVPGIFWGGGFKAKLFFQVFYFFLSCYFCVCTCFAMFTVQCGTACSVCRPDNPDHCLVCKQPGLLLQRGSCVTSCQDNFYVTRDAKCTGNIFQTLPLTLHQVLTGFGVKIYYSLIFFCELVTNNWYYVLFTFSQHLNPYFPSSYTSRTFSESWFWYTAMIFCSWLIWTNAPVEIVFCSVWLLWVGQSTSLLFHQCAFLCIFHHHFCCWHRVNFDWKNFKQRSNCFLIGILWCLFLAQKKLISHSLTVFGTHNLSAVLS